MTEQRINLIGAGRVGQTFLKLLSRLPGYRIQDVLSSRMAAAEAAVRFCGAGRPLQEFRDLRPADLWLLTVPDTRIAQVASQISGTLHAEPQAAPVAFHCSGFLPAAEMEPLRAAGFQLASVHPVLSFADADSAVTQFPGTRCGVEGDEPAVSRLQPVLAAIGARPFPVRSESKGLYHAAAVFSNNFTTVLQALAREAWAEAGVPEEVARDLNASLLRATADNIAAHGPQQALTGPAARGDHDVVLAQGREVTQWHPAAGQLYRELSDMAQRLKRQGRALAADEPPGT